MNRLPYVVIPLLASLIVAANCVQAQIVGTPWSGSAGVSLTVQQLQALEAAKPQEFVPRQALIHPVIPNSTKRLRNPASPQFPISQPSAGNIKPNVLDSRGPEFAQTVSTNFVGIPFAQSGGFVPPDTHGDVGPSQFLASVNLRLKSYTKGGASDGVLDIGYGTFFASVSGGAGLSDPRVIYDRIAQRWVIVLITTNFTPSSGNRILFAVSDTAVITPATVWTMFGFQQDLVSPAGNTGLLCDYPNAGLDVNAVYIGCDMFDNSFYYGSTVFVVRKSSLYSGGPIVVSAFRNLIAPGGANPAGAGPNTPKGVNNFDPTATEGFFIGEDNQFFGILDLLKISNPGTVPVLSPMTQITVADFQTPIPVDFLGNDHPGGTYNGKIDANDNRVMNAEIRFGNLWLAHGTAVDATGDGGTGAPDRNAVRWYSIGTPGATPTIVQSGTIYDATANKASYTYGSVNVNGQGHAAFGFTLLGPNNYPGVGFDGRFAADANGSTQGVQSALIGLGTYNGSGFDPGTSRPRRWGDYSNTSVDPADNMTFWTVQEYSLADGSWATRVIKLLAPPPATPVSASPSTVAAGLASVAVTVTGTQISGSGFFDPGPGFTRHIAAQIAGVTVNSISYVNPTTVLLDLNTTAATNGARNVTIVNPDGQTATGVALLTVGAPGPQINSATTLTSSVNPSGFGQSVSFTATVTAAPPGSGTPSGIVTFFDGAANLGSVAVAAGMATVITNTLTSGLHNISANYSGDASFFASSSATLVQQVQGVTATLVVTNTNDSGAGSLRNAISTANSGDTVTFALACPATITLTSGELLIGKSLSMIGPGARCLSVNGNALSRVFSAITSGTVGISGLTVTGGATQASDSNGGGGILNFGATLTLSGVAISGNSSALGVSGVGGGIDNESGGVITLINSTVSGNSNNFRGGGIQNQGGSTTVINSTISGNTSVRGGAIRNAGGSALTVINSTIANNVAIGGATGPNLSMLNGTAILQNSDLSGGVQADIHIQGGSVTSAGYNLVQTLPSAAQYTPAATDLTGLPLLNALANNGGQTDTMSPQPASPLIDKIPASGGCNGAGVGNDQRGLARPQGATCDIGAVEAGTIGVGATSTTLSSSPNPSSAGQPITLTATVTGATPTGSVAFFDGATLLGTAAVDGTFHAVLTTSSLATGARLLSAAYGGDATNGQSTSATLIQNVGLSSTTTAVAASVNPIAPGGSTTLTATVSAAGGGATPTGTVNFLDGGVLLGSSSLSGGIATLPTTALVVPGLHNIAATYVGSTTYNGSTSPVLVVTVTGGGVTTTVVASSVNPSNFGSPVTFTATVSAVNGSPTGTVTFKDGATIIGTGTLSAGGSATMITSTLPGGTRSITATYSGDGSFPASTSAPLSQVVIGGLAPPAPQSAVSRKVQGAGTFDLPVTLGP